MLLEGLLGYGDKPHLVEIGLLLAAAGKRQVSKVYWVETTTKKAETHTGEGVRIQGSGSGDL